MSRTRQRGSQAVEFALVLPFLILVIFAVIDLGIVVYNKSVLTNASREAARRGIILSAAAWNADTIGQVACNYARDALITVSTGTRTSTCSGTADPVVAVTPTAAPAFADPVTVTVTYTVKGFTLGTWWSLGTSSNVGSALTLTASTQMNHE
jgi:Flp pilus assembly protein TadG